MINFIIVEDNDFQRKEASDIVTKYMMKNKLEFNIKEYPGVTKEFKELVKLNEDNHIYILDFELPKYTAIDLARFIREKDWISPIIILSAHGGMAYESFKQRLQILDFVNKQYEAEKNLFELFDICLKQLNVCKSFKFKIRGIDYNIPFEKILYIYRDTVERKAVIVTNNNEYKMNINMKDMLKLLDQRFMFTHKACIVNTNRVRAYVWKDNKLVFDNKTEVYLLSSTRKKEIEHYVHN